MKGRLVGLVCFMVLMLASVPALAQRPHHQARHHGHHGHGGHGWRASFFVGGGYPAYRPYWRGAYYPRPVYYYPPPAYPVCPGPVAVPMAPVLAPTFSFSFGR